MIHQAWTSSGRNGCIFFVRAAAATITVIVMLIIKKMIPTNIITNTQDTTINFA
jgi:hypothetical protein